MASLNQARSILEKIGDRHTLSQADQSRLANCYAEIGILQGNLESGDHGLDMLEKAVAIQQQLIGGGPADFAKRQRLAEMINALGYVYSKRSDFPAAFHSFQQVQETCTSLLKEITEGPKPVKLLSLLALSHFNVGTIQVIEKQRENALQSFEKSLEYRRDLVESHPSVSAFRENLAKSYREVAIQEHQAGHSEIALLNLQKAFDILDKLIQSEPKQARYHSELGRTWNAIGYVHDETRNNEKAIPAFDSAIKEQENAMERSPDDNEYKAYLCIHLENQGEQYVDLGSVSKAWPYFDRALDIRRKLNGGYPENFDYAQTLIDAFIRLGSIQRHVGDPTTALKWFAERCAPLRNAF